MFEFKLVRFVTAAILMVTAGTLIARHVFAAQSQPCVVWDVKLDKTSSKLTVHCTNDDNHYVAAVGTSGCGSTNVENVKFWHAQAMSAMLSRSTSYVYYSTCTTGEKGIDGFLTVHP